MTTQLSGIASTGIKILPPDRQLLNAQIKLTEVWKAVIIDNYPLSIKEAPKHLSTRESRSIDRVPYFYP